MSQRVVVRIRYTFLRSDQPSADNIQYYFNAECWSKNKYTFSINFPKKYRNDGFIFFDLRENSTGYQKFENQSYVRDASVTDFPILQIAFELVENYFAESIDPTLDGILYYSDCKEKLSNTIVFDENHIPPMSSETNLVEKVTRKWYINKISFTQKKPNQEAKTVFFNDEKINNLATKFQYYSFQGFSYHDDIVSYDNLWRDDIVLGDVGGNYPCYLCYEKINDETDNNIFSNSLPDDFKEDFSHYEYVEWFFDLEMKSQTDPNDKTIIDFLCNNKPIKNVNNKELKSITNNDKKYSKIDIKENIYGTY